jgi:hypothetical protein
VVGTLLVVVWVDVKVVEGEVSVLVNVEVTGVLSVVVVVDVVRAEVNVVVKVEVKGEVTDVVIVEVLVFPLGDTKVVV